MLKRYNLSYLNFLLYIWKVNVSAIYFPSMDWIYKKTFAFVLLFKLVGAIKIITCAKVMKLKICVRERERHRAECVQIKKVGVRS